MSEDVDGRQTRPADHVGRPDGRAERAPIDGWREKRTAWLRAANAARKAFRVWQAAAQTERNLRAELAEAQTEIEREARERKRYSEAPHGETPQDAEA